ncbi:MAG TPA: BadF/BadG/BcrA/BcrD ATPase family protein [Desulfosporosinus sp.]|nr:BadF/BadG/BcrA/BcrD ATPase family protein [Desulfosporosinus sp.]
MNVKIGVDGGGSKTEIIALDPTGRVLRCLRKPASNYHVVGMIQAVSHIIEGIGDVLGEDTLEGIGITLAGIDTPEDWRIMAEGLKAGLKILGQEKMIRCQQISVVLENDVYGALMSVRGKFSGSVLVAGTGAIALGVDPEGDVIRVGGWGHIIGDQGAGYDIGRRALAAMVASFDGYGPKSILEEMIIEHLELAQVQGIRDWLYQKQRTNKEVAGLVPVVVQAARKGDLVSVRILEESGRALGLLTKALLRKTKSLEMGLVGGISNIWDLLELSFLTTVQEEFPALQILKPNFSPSVGAAFLSNIHQVRHIEF